MPNLEAETRRKVLLTPDDLSAMMASGASPDIQRNHFGDPARGHTLGSVNAPAYDDFMDEGTLTDSATLAAMHQDFGVADGRAVGGCCGAGMSAAVTVLSLASSGGEAAIHPVSWLQCVHDPARPFKCVPFP